ncbi:hypothetical protein BGZ54_002199 [Gamsiella multidivaricata]|nr:hypothetical protein BGZ54_002199 [Gamsiella multidivaricata]
MFVSSPSMENSDLEPVDLSSLEKLGNITFPNDYIFHQQLAQLIAKLQDPHTSYKSMCYQQFVFIQPLYTYGIYEDGRQQVEVATVLNKLDSRLKNALADCEVTHFDGRPAFDVVKGFAKTKPYNKDRGARINKSFAYLGHDKTGSPYDRYVLGTFAQRTNISPKATIKYKIYCRSKFSSGLPTESDSPLEVAFEIPWSALDATMAPYIDATSYRRQFRANDSVQTTKMFGLDSAVADNFIVARTRNLQGRKKSKELYRDAYASFHLLNDGVTGVFRLRTESPNKQEKIPPPSFYANIDSGFAALDAAGATKLIVDLQNNAGGIICWDRYVLQTLSPNTVDAPYIYSIRASPLTQALAKATFSYNQEADSPYGGFVNPTTGRKFSTDSWMIPGTKLPGRKSLFSNAITDQLCPAVNNLKGDPEGAMFQAKDIVLLTNGFCGSTCAALALQMHERYGVRTVAIARMGYTVARFRMPSILWEDVRDEVWGRSAFLDVEEGAEEGAAEDGEGEAFFGGDHTGAIVVVEEGAEEGIEAMMESAAQEANRGDLE